MSVLLADREEVRFLGDKKNMRFNPKLIMLVACGALGLLLMLYGGGYFTGDEESSAVGDQGAIIEYADMLEERPMMHLPLISLPTAKEMRDLLLWKSTESITS